jgi:uncharacterized membrane protein
MFSGRSVSDDCQTEVRSQLGQRQLDRLNQPELAKVIARNVQKIFEERRIAENKRNWHQRLADRITAFSGSMVFVALHALWFGGWIVTNSAVVQFDPGYADLTMIVSLEAIFLTSFVLVSQNRQGELADRRSELDLQINLLAEYEITRVLTLVAALAEQAGIKNCTDPELEVLKQDIEPTEVLREIEEQVAPKAELASG